MKFLLFIFGVLAQNQTEQILGELENRVMDKSKYYLKLLNEKLSSTFSKFEQVAQKISSSKNVQLHKELMATLQAMQSLSQDVK